MSQPKQYIRVWKKCLNSEVSNTAIDKVKAEYIKSNMNHSLNAHDHVDDYPIILDSKFSSNLAFNSSTAPAISTGYGRDDGKLYFELFTVFFGNSLHSLDEYYDLNAYVRSKSSTIISRDDIILIIQAAKYLCNEDYSNEFEDILSNGFIEILGSYYDKWSSRNFAETPIYDNDIVVEQKSTMKKLVNVLSTILAFEDEDNSEIVVELMTC